MWVDLQDLVSGLDGVMFNDLMENIEWFFNMHDKNKDGYLTKDEVLTLSESFLVRDSPPFPILCCWLSSDAQFIFRYELGDAYLGAVSRFMSNAFEYGDALLPQAAEGEHPHGNENKDGDGDGEGELTPRQRIESNQPYLNLATYVFPFYPPKTLTYSLLCRFRMVVLADEILESFFETDLSASFRLDPHPETETLLPSSSSSSASSGLLGDLWSTIATDSNKKMFNIFTDEIGKTIGKHQVCVICGGGCRVSVCVCVDCHVCVRLYIDRRSGGIRIWKSRKRVNRFLRLLCVNRRLNRVSKLKPKPKPKPKVKVKVKVKPRAPRPSPSPPRPLRRSP